MSGNSDQFLSFNFHAKQGEGTSRIISDASMVGGISRVYLGLLWLRWELFALCNFTTDPLLMSSLSHWQARDTVGETQPSPHSLSLWRCPQLYLTSPGRCLALSEWDARIRITWLAHYNRPGEKLAGHSVLCFMLGCNDSIAVTLAWGDRLERNEFPLHMKGKWVKKKWLNGSEFGGRSMEDLRAVKVIKAVSRYYLECFADPQEQLTGKKDFLWTARFSLHWGPMMQ